MSLASATYRGRRAAEARQLDTFDIKFPTGAYVYDPAANDGTGGDVLAYDLLFTTKGRVKSTGTIPHESEVGGRTSVTISRELHIPVNSPVVPVGAVAVCTAVHSASDPSLLGASLRISGPAPGSQTTARRLAIGEVLS